MPKKQDTKKTGNNAGLSGVIVGDSAIATVGLKGKGLNYRGYRIEELSEHSNFEETAFLLLKGHLPSNKEFDDFCRELWSQRRLPDGLKTILETFPASSHPMDITRTIISALGIFEPENEDFSNALECTVRVIGVLGPAILYWYHFS